jgi:ribosomal protein L11 methyltransferase
LGAAAFAAALGAAALGATAFDAVVAALAAGALVADAVFAAAPEAFAVAAVAAAEVVFDAADLAAAGLDVDGDLAMRYPTLGLSGHGEARATINMIRYNSGVCSMSYSPVQIVARGARAETEAAASAIDADLQLEGATYSILEEDEDRGLWRIDAFPTTQDEEAAIALVLSGFQGLQVNVAPLADADWLAMSLSGLPPVTAGRFFVYGAHDQGRVPLNSVALKIDAGAAFGTGHHGTTVGCLIAYDTLLKRERFERVLDVGCGTGVLAIAAARTGSRIAIGTDLDGPSVRIANENARLNRARASFIHASGLDDQRVRSHGPYDLVFANILAPPLVALSQDIKGALRIGGVAILSGLLRTQERRVTAAYISRGFRLERRIHRDAWSALVLRRMG